MSPTQVADLVLSAERAGRARVILVTYRDREPRRTIRLLPGVTAVVVGTERDGDRRKVIVDVPVAALRRWYERTQAKLPDDTPDDLLTWGAA